jgi:hypothetical protein
MCRMKGDSGAGVSAAAAVSWAAAGTDGVDSSTAAIKTHPARSGRKANVIGTPASAN